MNKLFEGQNKVPGSEFENGFFEGYDYVMKDGKPFYEDENRIDLTRNFITVPPRDPYLEVSTFRDLAQTVVVSDVWKEFGFGAIVFLAALTGINPSLYEAAEIDGASRWRQTSRTKALQ